MWWSCEAWFRQNNEDRHERQIDILDQTEYTRNNGLALHYLKEKALKHVSHEVVMLLSRDPFTTCLHCLKLEINTFYEYQLSH